MIVNKIILTILGLLAIALFSAGVHAHPPKALDLTYDFPGQTLTVSIEHWAVTPSVHYVEKVEISKNGKKVETKQYTSQPDTENFSYTIKVPAVDGDVLEVKAVCSVYGEKHAKLKVRKPIEEKKEAPTAEEKKDAPKSVQQEKK